MFRLFFILILLASNSYFLIIQKCESRFVYILNNSIEELIKYDYREYPYDKIQGRFFIVHELNYDTTSCRLKFTFDHSVEYDDLIDNIGNSYILIDSNVVVFSESSSNLLNLIPKTLKKVNDSLVESFGRKLYIKEEGTITSGNDLWIVVDHKYNNTNFSICGKKLIPIFLNNRNIEY